MLFNSLEFLLFLPTVFILYWFVTNRNLKLQNLLILVASYVFYGWWDWRFLSLIAFSTAVDYFAGLRIYNADKKSTRRLWLWISMICNLGLLGFFKYYNFFVQSWIDAFASIGYDNMHASTLKIILPVGISFYTFQTMSYSLDIYKKNLEPTKDFIGFAAFVSFFPQLVAGPIERATNLLPQILNKRKFDYKRAVQGMRLILWGLFKKVVIADTLAVAVNDIFANYTTYYTDYSGGTLILGALCFAFQIYGDFSGYSDIAIGTSKLFGIELMTNFKFPYFSRDIAEFWRRWHISLSTWFRDYVYIPLGGSRVGRFKAFRNIFIVFIVSGFWHGANWTFIIWGGIHAIMYIPIFFFGNHRSNVDNLNDKYKYIPGIKDLLKIGITFILVTLAWVFFRAENVSKAIDYLTHMELTMPSAHRGMILYILLIMLIDYIMYMRLDGLFVKYRAIRWLLYICCIFSLLLIGTSEASSFIYFQF